MLNTPCQIASHRRAQGGQCSGRCSTARRCGRAGDVDDLPAQGGPAGRSGSRLSAARSRLWAIITQTDQALLAANPSPPGAVLAREWTVLAAGAVGLLLGTLAAIATTKEAHLFGYYRLDDVPPEWPDWRRKDVIGRRDTGTVRGSRLRLDRRGLNKSAAPTLCGRE